MLIRALNDYYAVLERKSREEDDAIKKSTIPPEGFSVWGATHRVFLNEDGTIDTIADIRDARIEKQGKKEKTIYTPRYMFYPKRTEKSAVDLNIIEHRPLYIFGLNYDKKSGTFTTEDKTNKAKKSHECFAQGNLEFTEGMTSPMVTAYRNFIENWECGKETENEHLLKIAKEYPTASFCFALAGHPEITLNDMEGEIAVKVRETLGESADADGVCAVSGKETKISRIHDKIKGIRGGQASGGLLVCFKGSAVDSYNKEQSYNASISETVMKHYTAALNSVIGSENHHMYVEDLTVVFWALSAEDDDEASRLYMEQINGGDDEDEIDDEGELNDSIKSAMDELKQGRKTDLLTTNIDKNIPFYVVGLAPNNSRISLKFIYHDSFGAIFENVEKHQKDMDIIGSKRQIPLWRMNLELKPPKSKNEKIPPPLLAGIFRAVLDGGMYPESLLETVIRRVKTDKSINYVRAGIIKACLNRKIRIHKRTEEFKMALDKECTNAGYVCGRLFAALEKIQEDALGTEINSTIKDSYFASAASNPGAVFPRIVRLSQNHMKKLKSEKRGLYVNREKLTGEIMDKLGTSFPNTLTLNEQGEFCLGYYHQRQSFFKSHKDND